MKNRPFELIYAPLIRRHLKTIEPKYYSLIRETIKKQLSIEPDTETINRKPLKRPSLGATWEIRFGPSNRFRVLYKVNLADRQVNILAIGVKDGEQLRIGGEEIKL